MRVVGLVLTTGCASVTKGTTQSVTVNTDPSGATCTMARDGKPLAVVNPTPGSVTVGKSFGTISVNCKKAGYQDAAGVVASTFQAMTFGNILFGGLIGVAVDAASGAMSEYPPMVTITLVPESFGTEAERDHFYNAMKATLIREADEVRARINASCKVDCEAQLKAVDTGTARKLEDIEKSRLSARVRTP
jgi:hypothetical protein